MGYGRGGRPATVWNHASKRKTGQASLTRSCGHARRQTTGTLRRGQNDVLEMETSCRLQRCRNVQCGGDGGIETLRWRIYGTEVRMWERQSGLEGDKTGEGERVCPGPVGQEAAGGGVKEKVSTCPPMTQKRVEHVGRYLSSSLAGHGGKGGGPIPPHFHSLSTLQYRAR